MSVVGGESLTINGRLDGELSVFGGEVTVNGLVDNDINIFNGSMQINGVVNGDVVLFGGQQRAKGSRNPVQVQRTRLEAIGAELSGAGRSERSIWFI